MRLTGEADYHADWRKAADRPDAPAELPETESPSLIDLMRMTYEEPLVREHAAWALRQLEDRAAEP